MATSTRKPTSTTSRSISINDVLADRGKQYGDFGLHADVTQQLKETCLQAELRTNDGESKLTRTEQEALDMILHKIGRIVNGNPHLEDSWVDIAGYAQLVVNELRGKRG